MGNDRSDLPTFGSLVGPIVKFHRRRAGLNQAELAELAGIGKTVVFNIEHGKQTVQMDTLSKLLSVLNIQLQFLSPLMKAFEEEQEIVKASGRKKRLNLKSFRK